MHTAACISFHAFARQVQCMRCEQHRMQSRTHIVEASLLLLLGHDACAVSNAPENG